MGAGTGATVARAVGMAHAVKGGIGSASVELGGVPAVHELGRG